LNHIRSNSRHDCEGDIAGVSPARSTHFFPKMMNTPARRRRSQPLRKNRVKMHPEVATRAANS
jgi:hypothetical protein